MKDGNNINLDKHRHHKQPQFFLKGFAAKSNNHYQKIPDIYVYKKGEAYKDGTNPSLESVKETGYGDDFYAYTKDDGNKDFNTYENILMKDFEQPARPVLEKIRRFEEINEKERLIFLKYVASMATRGDWWKNVCDDALEKAKQEIEIEALSKFYGNEEKIKELVEERANIIQKGNSRNESMIEKAEKLANILSKMEWRFLISPYNLHYLTSDNPVFYREVNKADSELIFPVSSRVTLSLSWKKVLAFQGWKKETNSFWSVDYKVVAQIRKLICSIAINEVYYSQKAKWLVEFVNNQS